MTDRPIIFSAPMVLALLEGRKTQTRRLASSPLRVVQPGDRLWVRESCDFDIPHDQSDRLAHVLYGADRAQAVVPMPGGNWAWKYDRTSMGRMRPSIHMPRWASRLTLTVTDVRVQRLGRMSSSDARAEGPPIEPYDTAWADEDPRRWVLAFAALWDKLHGAGEWEKNPEVVALSFTVERRNIDHG